MNKQSLFLENARMLFDKMRIIPLLYGSLGLEYLTGENLSSDDIDILIPKVFISERWSEFKDIFEKSGYILTDEREHTFVKDGVSYSYADIEELETFAGIKISEISICETDNIRFMLLSLQQYLQVYKASAKDGYRVNVREKKDNEKIAFIEELLQRENIEYTIIHAKTAETEIYFHTLGEDIRGYLSGKNAEEVLKISERIQNCLCGGIAELHEFEGMGDGSYTICCKSCNRTLIRSPYDVDINNWEEVLEFCIRDWNIGLSAEDIKKVNKAEYERIRLREEDLIWKDFYPNNMKSNGIEGCYSLVFTIKNEQVYCCKWTILYQKEEIEPGTVSWDSPIEAYILFIKHFFEVKGPMYYPEPSDCMDWNENDENTFSDCGVNDQGEFVRSYKTLEDAKLGAVSRCGWQGINRDTILREEDYQGKTAEEIITKI